MPKTLKPSEIDALARQLTELFKHGADMQRQRLMDALIGQHVLTKIMHFWAVHQHRWSHRDMIIKDLTHINSIDQNMIHNLTHFIAIGFDGNQTKVILDLERASAREAAVRIVGAERTEEMTPNAAASQLGISRTHLRHLMDNGLIRFRKVGTHHRIHPDEVARVKAEWARRRQSMADMEAASTDIDT